MQLRPRHFILLAVVLGLFVFNIIRNRQRQHELLREQQQTQTQTTGATAAAWSAFDQAAALRDAPDEKFQPAFTALRSATEGATPGQDPLALRDVRACKTWLVFYRNPEWRANSKKHIDGCTKYHRDTDAQ